MAVRIKTPRASYRDSGLTDVATNLAQVVRSLNAESRWKPDVLEPSAGTELRVGTLSLLLSGKTYYLPSSALPGEALMVACEAGTATVKAATKVVGGTSLTVGAKAQELFYTGNSWV